MIRRPSSVMRANVVSNYRIGPRAFGREKDIGTIATGKLADLDILDVDPTANPANLSCIHSVIKDGRVFDPDELMRAYVERLPCSLCG